MYSVLQIAAQCQTIPDRTNLLSIRSYYIYLYRSPNVQCLIWSQHTQLYKEGRVISEGLKVSRDFSLASLQFSAEVLLRSVHGVT